MRIIENFISNNTMGLKNNIEKFDTIGDNHIGTSTETPMRADAFKLSADEKIEIIKDDVQHIMY